MCTVIFNVAISVAFSDVLFALGVVLLGRRLSRCPKAQRVLEFVSEA